MTAAVAARTVRADTARRPFAGTAKLVRFNLRRDRVRLPAWLAGITFAQVAGAASYPGVYPTAADRQNQAAVIGENPAMRAMTGPGFGLDDYTYGAMMTNEYLGLMVVFAALMSVFLVVRHTRGEEESGRAELVRASVVGRYAHLTAALVTATIACAGLGLLITLGMGGLGIETVDWTGSLYYGAAFAAVGLVFAAVAAVTAQLSEFSRTASGIAGASIGVAYVLRAVGDAGDNGLSWASPIGWAQASAPYVLNRLWPLALALGVAAALAAAAFALSARRDLGAGLRAGRTGAATASPALGTPLGFAWRLHRASVLWWAVAMLLLGLAYGSAVDVIERYADNQVVQDVVDSIGGFSLTESWLSMVIALLAMICTVFAVIAALRGRREESAGRAEMVLATALGRTRWLDTHVVIAMAGGAGLLLVAGLGLGGGAAAMAGDGGLLWDVLLATLAYAPALWLTAGLAVALYGLVPRLTGAAWALLVYAVFMVYFGGLLDLPGWMLDVSPYTHIPRMPAADFSATPLLVLTVLAAALTAAGRYGFRRRDVEAT